jgi:hypothetical protein
MVCQPCPRPKKFKEYLFERVPNYYPAWGATHFEPALTIVFYVIVYTKATARSLMDCEDDIT